MKNPSERKKYLTQLNDEEVYQFAYDWNRWARQDQCAPIDKHWTTWLILGGRGAGKTRTGAEWIRGLIEGVSPNDAGKVKSVALIGESYADVREIMVEGPSGLKRICHPSYKPEYEVSRRRLVWPNGGVATCFSAEDPEGLRGYQFEAAWSDELCKWRYAEDSWSNLQLALRLGECPQQVVTTTPRPQALLKRLMAQKMTHVTRTTTYHNSAFLADTFMSEIAAQYEGTALGRQELLGEIVEDQAGALWTWQQIEEAYATHCPDLDRIVIAVDPPISSGPRSDECGIIVAGSCTSGDMPCAYVLADFSVAGKTPLSWAKKVVEAYHQFEADRIIVESNQGGEMAQTIIAQIDKTVPVRNVYATRSKKIRAEPVAALYERRQVRHVGRFSKLEDQMTNYTGAANQKSPDRLDALVWALTALLLTQPSGMPKIRKI